jgi:hypothetical protein
MSIAPRRCSGFIDEIEHFQQVGARAARAKKAVAVNFTDVSNAEGRARRTYGPTDHRPD